MQHRIPTEIPFYLTFAKGTLFSVLKPFLCGFYLSNSPALLAASSLNLDGVFLHYPSRKLAEPDSRLRQSLPSPVVLPAQLVESTASSRSPGLRQLRGSGQDCRLGAGISSSLWLTLGQVLYLLCTPVWKEPKPVLLPEDRAWVQAT